MTGTDQNLVDTIRLLLKGKLGGEPDVYLTHDGHIRVETRVGAKVGLGQLRAAHSATECVDVIVAALRGEL